MRMMGPEKPSLLDLAHHGVKGQKWGVRKATKNYAAVSEQVFQRQVARRLNESISEEAYNKLSSKDRVIEKGSLLKRTTATPDLDRTSDRIFISTNEKDARNYRALLPTGTTNGVPAKKHEGYYETTLQATNALKSPSEKERVDAYVRLMDVPEIKLATGENVTGREFMRRSGLGDVVDKLSSKQIALTYYGQLVVAQGIRDEPLNSAYFKSLAAKGYNALIDDNDRGILANEPVLTLQARRDLKTVHVKQLSTNDIHEAQATMALPELPQAPHKAPSP